MMQPIFMEKLLDRVEIEWIMIGDERFVEIANSNRKPVKASLRKSGKTPYFGANNIQDYVEGFTHNGVFVLIAEDGSASLENYSIQWATGQFWANNHIHVLRGKGELDSRFLYHYLKTIDFNPFLSGGGRPKLTKSKLVEILIPIPCPDNPEKSLEIQAEIVRILDTFTELTSELTSELTLELTARKKQYTYYRDQLLMFEEGEVEWKSLGEIAKIQRGASPRPIAKFITDDEDGVPWIKIGDTIPNSKYVSQTKQKITSEGAQKSRLLEKGDFILSNSMSFGRPYILNIDGAIHDGWASITGFNNKLNSDFLYHFLSSDLVQNYWVSKINSGSVSNLNADIIKSLKIPLPSLLEQSRIVSILDKLDTLTTSITEELPREIDLRQKQYEHYRNMLLYFPKEEVAK